MPTPCILDPITLLGGYPSRWVVGCKTILNSAEAEAGTGRRLVMRFWVKDDPKHEIIKLDNQIISAGHFDFGSLYPIDNY